MKPFIVEEFEKNFPSSLISHKLFYWFTSIIIR